MIHSGKTLLCDKICKFETNQIYLFSVLFSTHIASKQLNRKSEG